MKTVLKIICGFVLLAVLGAGAAFYFTAGLVDEADTFMTLLKENKTEEAYSRLSSEFKRTTSEEQLGEFLQANSLVGLKEVSWGNRQFSNDQGLVNGTVTTADDTKLPIELHFVSEDSEWKILGIHKAETGISNGTSSPQVLPPEDQQITLVQRSMHDFGVSVNAKNMSHFHESLSRTWQSQYDVPKLDDAYKGLYGMDGDLTKISSLSPIFTEPAKLDEKGVMRIAGFFPTNPKKVKFEQSYVQEGTQWKLLGFHINFTG